MGYFNFKYILSILRILTKPLKWFLIIIGTLLALFLIFNNSNSVSAITLEDYNNNITYDVPDFPSSNFDSNYCVIWKNGDNLNMITGTGTGSSNISALHLVWQGGNKFLGWSGINSYWASDVTTYVYSSTVNSSSWTLTNTYTDTTFAPEQFYDPEKLIYTSLTVYQRGVGDIYSSSDFGIYTFNPPQLYPNADSEQQSNLVSGQFTWFVIDPR